MTYFEIIANRILSLCAERKITVNKLATLSGLSHSTLENIIKGNTKSTGIRSLHRIAQGLNMTLSEFFDFSEINEVIPDDE
jgi:transcriptional regulator with XRE-family HTH domain